MAVLRHQEQPWRPGRAQGLERASCESCGLWGICFPGRVASDVRAPAKGLGIRRMRLPRGKVLYRAGEKVECFYMIRSGCIKETQDSTCHRSTVINFALAGEMLSLHNPDDQVSSTTSVAVEASFICAGHWGSFNELCAASPGIAAEFIRLVVKAGAQARELLTLIRDKEALERIAGFLLNLSDRLQLRGVQGREFRLGMNRDDIASYLGVRSETVSRSFTELSRRRLIRVRAKRVQITKPAELRGVCDGT